MPSFQPIRPLSRRRLIEISLGACGAVLTGLPALARDADGNRLDRRHADKLAGLMRGPLILPDDPRYDGERQVWNAMIDRRPSAIASCESDADVIAVVRYAAENDLPVTVRGGGHNVAGKSVRDGALVIDLGRMQDVRVHAAAKRATVQGGARWATFDRESLAHGLYTTGGTVGTTGVGGLTLGGGLGWLMREHGLSCDNVLAADVVTADGELRRASPDHDADLYWAIRGGGGNFGVVTSFDFQLHDEKPAYGGIIIYPEDKIGDMLALYRELAATAPDALTAMAAVAPGTPETPLAGRPMGMIIFFHTGEPADGERLAEPLRDLGPAVDGLDVTNYASQQALFAAAGAPGMRSYWRSNFMRELDDGVFDLMIEKAKDLPPPGSMFLIEPMGAAIGRVGVEETAFSHRNANFNVSVLAGWPDAADDPDYIDWTRATGDELRTFATGGAYVNYMADDESAEAVRGAYEANFRRLGEIKHRYDPDNFFSGNHNIAPAGGA